MFRKMKMLKDIYKTRFIRKFNLTPSLNSISAHLTWNCNSRCSTCGIWRAPIKKIEIEPEIYRDNIFKTKIAKNLPSWAMSGGEAILYRGIFDLTHYCLNTLPKTRISIGTNCIASKRLMEYMDTFKNFPIHFSFSIDGLGNIHDEIRGIKGNFDKFLSVVNYIQDLQEQGSKLTFATSTCISKLNLYHIPELIQWIKLHGFGYQMTNTMFTDYIRDGNQRKTRNELEIVEQKDLDALINLFKSNPRVTYDVYIKYMRGLPYPIAPCYAAQKFIQTDPDGRITACTFLHDEIGNFIESTLDEIWQGNRIKEIRKKRRQCVACAKYHPNISDAQNNLNIHGTLKFMALKRKIKRKIGLQ